MNKKILSIFLVVTMLASLMTFVSVSAAEQLAHYSFESQDGWLFWNTKGSDVNVVSTDKATDGKASLYVKDNSNELAGGFQGTTFFPATVGETYSVTFDAFCETAGITMYIRFYGADKKTQIDNGKFSIKANKKWESVSFSKVAPEGAQYVHVLAATNAKGNGVAYIDNVKLFKGAVAATSSPSKPSASQQTSSANPSVDINAEGSKYQTEIEFLGKIGLLDKDFDIKGNITKAEMTKRIAKIMHPELDFSTTVDGSDAFVDVPSSHAYYPYIRACKDLRIINGDFENKFYPDNQLTAIEAMAMVINALGYTPYAQALGNYPTGYYSVASQTGISKGINIASTEPVTGEVAAKILYNALFADLIELHGITSSMIEIEINNGKNILSERLGIYEYDAIVSDNGVSSIYGETMGDTDRAVIRDVKSGKTISAYVGDTDVSSYLGYRVKAFIKNYEEMGRNEFIYVAPHKSSEIVTINAKDIVNKTSSYIEYDEDISTLSTSKVQYNNMDIIIIVNGTVVSGYSLTDVLPTDGFVSFVENDEDTGYDIVNITSFNYKDGSFTEDARNIVVDSVNLKEGKESIACVFNPSLNIDLDEDNTTYLFLANSDVKALSEIKEMDIVSVAEAPVKIKGKTHYVLAVKREVVKGTLSGRADNELSLDDGKDYKLSSSLTGPKEHFADYLSLGKGITLNMDITGKVGYAESEGGNSKNYAYLVKAVKKSDASEYVLAKVFTKAGEMKEARLSEKVRIDGVQCKDAASQIAALETRFQHANLKALRSDDEKINKMGRPVIIDFNSNGDIIRIDTDTPNPVYNSGDYSDFYKTQTLIQYTEEDANSVETLKAGIRAARVASVMGSGKTVEGKFFITSNTTILAVPEIDTYGIKPEAYNAAASYGISTTNAKPDIDAIKLYELKGDQHYKALASKNVYAERYSYDIQAYDIDPDTGVAGLIVLRGMNDVVSSYSSDTVKLCVFNRTTTVYDPKFEKSVTKVYYYDNSGAEQSALVDLDEALFSVKYKITGKPSGVGETAALRSGEIKALQKGDIIRVATNNDGYISRLDRLVSLRDYKKTLYPANGCLQYGMSFPYSGSASYGPAVRVGERYTNERTLSYGYLLGAGYIKAMNGKTARLALSRDTYLGNIGTAYTEAYMNLGSSDPVVVTFDESKDMRVESGSFNDVITVDEIKNNNYDEASLVLFSGTDMKIQTVFIINGLEHIIGK